MNYRFSKLHQCHQFKPFGYMIVIEYRVKLKVWDLIFYPNAGTTYGARQYYDKLVCRHSDFTALVACIIKTVEDFADSKVPFTYILKHHTSELTTCDALRKASETPAQ